MSDNTEEKTIPVEQLQEAVQEIKDLEDEIQRKAAPLEFMMG